MIRIKKRYLYRLIDPRNKQTFYIGITENPGKRLAEHCSLSTKTNKEKIEEIMKDDEYPVMETILSAECDMKTMLEIEKNTITKFKNAGLNSIRILNR